ncbi:MAG: biotin/lipoyl-containing protein, partial [Dehalococcoidia bacterium]
LRWALDNYVLVGVTTNLLMLLAVVSDSEFVAGNTDTRFVERRIEPLVRREAQLPPEVLLSAAAYKLGNAGLLGGRGVSTETSRQDPWRSAGPWRLGRWGMEYQFGYQDRTLHAVVSHHPGTRHWEIQTGEEVFDVDLRLNEGGQIEVRQGEVRWEVNASPQEDGLSLQWKGRAYLLGEPRPAAVGQSDSATASTEVSTTLKSPMPGQVVRIRVREGEQVAVHQILLVLEAMKMEHLITAPYQGLVRRIHCSEGQQVAKGASLLELERL